MNLFFIPQPHRIKYGDGLFSIPLSGTIGISDNRLEESAFLLRNRLGIYTVRKTRRPGGYEISMALDRNLPPDGYKLQISPKHLRINAQSPAGAVYAVKTLDQVMQQSQNDRLPVMSISDWPDFPCRGLYYDVSRGRVPHLKRLIEQVEILAAYKINQYQLYFEHTFLFPEYPELSRGVSPLNAEDILSLDAVCRKNGVELVPSLASFGHMSRILTHRRFRHMAEDFGTGKYASPEAGKVNPALLRRGWTISPACKDTYAFLDSLFSEFLPLFSSDKFNVCCDETWDLGLGQTSSLCAKKGHGRVYLDHIMMLRKLAARYGKKIMFWGDIIRKYPELLKSVPRDVTVLHWNYSGSVDPVPVRRLRRARRRFYVCPGTSSWTSLFPRMPESTENISKTALLGRKNRADGLLNTDWGDGGHYNFMELSWYGYLFGAEKAWNANADSTTFPVRFQNLFLKCRQGPLPQIIQTIGDISHLSADGYYQSIWLHIFFATPDDGIFRAKYRTCSISRKGIISRGKVRFNAALARSVQSRLNKIRPVLESCSLHKYHDPFGIMPYWIFAVDTLLHAAGKLAALSTGKLSPADARLLLDEIIGLKKRFTELWMARNRRSEIEISLNKYDRLISAYRKASASKT